MPNQLKVNFYKLKKFPLTYVAILFMFIIGFSYGYLILSNGFTLNEVFSEVVCDTSLLFIISVVASWFISEDFGNRTITNELKLGYSRLSVILSRSLIVYIQSFIMHFTYVASSMLGFFVVCGFDINVFCKENIIWLLTVTLQLIAIESGTIIVCFAARKPTGAISISVIYTFITCNLLRNFMDNKVFTLSCFCLVRTYDTKLLISSAISALLTAVAFIFTSAIIFNKAELK